MVVLELDVDKVVLALDVIEPEDVDDEVDDAEVVIGTVVAFEITVSVVIVYEETVVNVQVKVTVGPWLEFHDIGT